MTTIYTIGHSRHPAERFVALLRAHEIACLVDVRSQPASRWTPHFGKAALGRLLADHGIDYVFLGTALGGRPAGAEYYLEGGAVDYARRARAEDFRAGIEELSAIARTRTVAIMCAEEDPAHCHRRVLVAPALESAGTTVIHLRGDGRTQR
jgi:uncharacterized protein (DUF488 family)